MMDSQNNGLQMSNSDFDSAISKVRSLPPQPAIAVNAGFQPIGNIGHTGTSQTQREHENRHSPAIHFVGFRDDRYWNEGVMAVNKLKLISPKEIWKARKPDNLMVWSVCPYVDRKVGDGFECRRCPKWQQNKRGKFKKGCRALAEEVCRIVMAARKRKPRRKSFDD